VFPNFVMYVFIYLFIIYGSVLHHTSLKVCPFYHWTYHC